MYPQLLIELLIVDFQGFVSDARDKRLIWTGGVSHIFRKFPEDVPISEIDDELIPDFDDMASLNLE